MLGGHPARQHGILLRVDEVCERTHHVIEVRLGEAETPDVRRPALCQRSAACEDRVKVPEVAPNPTPRDGCELHHAQVEETSERCARIRQRLVMAEFAKQENLKATAAEIDSEFQAVFAERDTKPQERAKLINDPERRLMVASEIVNRKLRDFLMGVVKVTKAD